MADDKERKEPHLTGETLAERVRRERRLGAALRQNLRRRRRQNRVRGEKGEDEVPPDPSQAI